MRYALVTLGGVAVLSGFLLSISTDPVPAAGIFLIGAGIAVLSWALTLLLPQQFRRLGVGLSIAITLCALIVTIILMSAALRLKANA